MFYSKNRTTRKASIFAKQRSLFVENLETRDLMAGLLNPTMPASSNLNTRVDAIVGAIVGSGIAGERIVTLVSEAQKANLAQLKSDLASIRAGSQVTPEQIAQLKTDFVLLVQGTTKPSSESVATLKTDLTNFLEDDKLTTAEQAKLVIDVKAVLSSANVPVSEVQAVASDLKSILASSGLNKETIATIRTDLQNIASEFLAQHPGR